jgi:hypothetical protein
MHNFNPNHKCVHNFSSLSLKAAEKLTRNFFVNGGGGHAAWQTDFFWNILKREKSKIFYFDFSEMKPILAHISNEENKNIYCQHFYPKTVCSTICANYSRGEAASAYLWLSRSKRLHPIIKNRKKHECIVVQKSLTNNRNIVCKQIKQKKRTKRMLWSAGSFFVDWCESLPFASCISPL